MKEFDNKHIFINSNVFLIFKQVTRTIFSTLVSDGQLFINFINYM